MCLRVRTWAERARHYARPVSSRFVQRSAYRFRQKVRPSRCSSAFGGSASRDVSAHDRQPLLSSFAREIVRLRELLEQRPRTLWLIDEFARTTAPGEAYALLLALLGALRKRDGCAIAATHLIELDAQAEIAHFAVGRLRSDGTPPEFAGTEDALRALAERMDYRIERAPQAREAASDALELAAWLGLDKELVQSAKDILSRCSR